MTRWLAFPVALCLAAAASGGDVASGPKVGDKLEGFTVFGVVGPVEDKEVDYIKERKDAPTVFVFVQHPGYDRQQNKFIKTLDSEIKDINKEASIVTVFIAKDKDETKKFLPRIQQSVQFAHTALTVFGDQNGPNGWGINADAKMTVVIGNKGKVAATFAYNAVNETDVPKVKEALKNLDGKK